MAEAAQRGVESPCARCDKHHFNGVFSTCLKESSSIMLSDAAGVSKTLPAQGLPLYLHKHVVEFQKNKCPGINIIGEASSDSVFVTRLLWSCFYAVPKT